MSGLKSVKKNHVLFEWPLITSFQEVPNGGISDMEAASLFPTAIISACCDMASISDHPFTSFSQFVQVYIKPLQTLFNTFNPKPVFFNMGQVCHLVDNPIKEFSS